MSGLHRFSRTELFIGAEALNKLRSSSVIIFGVGGVGSYAAETLCRAGVGRISIVDYDDVRLSGINRQLHALEQTVGQPNCSVVAKRLRLINPQALIIPHREFYSPETAPFLLSEHHDYVLDAMDLMASKVHLIKTCRKRNMPIISGMGGAMKRDPTLIRVADISRTTVCRTARSLHKLLREEGIQSGVTVVYSTEEPAAIPAPDERNAHLNPDADERRSKAPQGTISYIPALIGLTMAGMVVNALMGE